MRREVVRMAQRRNRLVGITELRDQTGEIFSTSGPGITGRNFLGVASDSIKDAWALWNQDGNSVDDRLAGPGVDEAATVAGSRKQEARVAESCCSGCCRGSG